MVEVIIVMVTYVRSSRGIGSTHCISANSIRLCSGSKGREVQVTLSNLMPRRMCRAKCPWQPKPRSSFSQIKFLPANALSPLSDHPSRDSASFLWFVAVGGWRADSQSSVKEARLRSFGRWDGTRVRRPALLSSKRNVINIAILQSV
jgi:hypothetical protein